MLLHSRLSDFDLPLHIPQSSIPSAILESSVHRLVDMGAPCYSWGNQCGTPSVPRGWRTHWGFTLCSMRNLHLCLGSTAFTSESTDPQVEELHRLAMLIAIVFQENK